MRYHLFVVEQVGNGELLYNLPVVMLEETPGAIDTTPMGGHARCTVPPVGSSSTPL